MAVMTFYPLLASGMTIALSIRRSASRAWESHSLLILLAFPEFKIQAFDFIGQINEFQDKSGGNDIIIAEWILIGGIFDNALLDNTDYANSTDRN